MRHESISAIYICENLMLKQYLRQNLRQTLPSLSFRNDHKIWGSSRKKNTIYALLLWKRHSRTHETWHHKHMRHDITDTWKTHLFDVFVSACHVCVSCLMSPFPAETTERDMVWIKGWKRRISKLISWEGLLKRDYSPNRMTWEVKGSYPLW